MSRCGAQSKDTRCEGCGDDVMRKMMICCLGWNYFTVSLSSLSLSTLVHPVPYYYVSSVLKQVLPNRQIDRQTAFTDIFMLYRSHTSSHVLWRRGLVFLTDDPTHPASLSWTHSVVLTCPLTLMTCLSFLLQRFAWNWLDCILCLTVCVGGGQLDLIN